MAPQPYIGQLIPTGLLDTLYAANVLWHASGELESHDNSTNS